jgi:hypothetical protein
VQIAPPAPAHPPPPTHTPAPTYTPPATYFPPPTYTPPVQALPPPTPTAAPSAPVRKGPSAGTRVFNESVLPWLPRVAAVLALGATVVVGGRYAWNLVANRAARPAPATPQPPPHAPPAATAARPQAPGARRRATGGLEITTTPPGAQVVVDGKPRGVTPLTLADLAAGRHTVELRSSAGTVERTVTIAADQTAQIEESIFSGWLAVHSPFDVAISEGNRALTLDDRNQVMLPPGRHQVRVVSRALAYDVVHPVDLKPGDTTHLTVNPAPSTLTLTASETVGVWLDGEKVGETPLTAVPATLGTHDLLVRRANGGERRLTITVTANPFALHIDFSRQ